MGRHTGKSPEFHGPSAHTDCLKQGAQWEPAPVVVLGSSSLTSPQTYWTLNNSAFRNKLELYNEWLEHMYVPVAFEIFTRKEAPFASIFACDPDVINTQPSSCYRPLLYNCVRAWITWRQKWFGICTFFFFNLKTADLNICCVYYKSPHGYYVAM